MKSFWKLHHQSWPFEILAIACLCFLPGCERAPAGPPLVPVKGTVTVDGEPLPVGSIYLSPVDGIAGSYSGEIQQGKFSIQSAVGLKHVSIVASRLSTKVLGPDGKLSQEQYLPAKYNVKTELTAEVVADKPNSMSFDLLTK